ncbi:MAG: NAD+ synthase [Deltaproteobacteria bacterium]|nr:MAG: NAD+ synthase [Deltaproteobacteria bacterium]
MPLLRVALAQINTTVGDLSGNADKIIHYTGMAREKGVDMVTFPELSLCGYPPEDILLKRQFLDDCKKTLKSIITKTSGITCVVGFPEACGASLYNAAALIHDGKLTGVYRKVLLPNYGVFDEKRYFEPGKEGVVLVLNGVAIGINICEDSWFSEGPAKAEVQKGGAKVIANISASPYYAGKRKVREQVLKKLALDNECFILYNNLVGGQDELIFDGGSFILDPNGELLANSRQFDEDMLLFDLEIPQYEPLCSENSLMSSDESLSGEVRRFSISSVVPSQKQKIPEARIRWLDYQEEIYSALVLGVRDYARKNGFPKVLIGISGGIDSALTAAIAVDALGAEAVVGVTMPSRFSSEGTKEDARFLSDNLGIRLISIPIEQVFNSYLDILKPIFNGMAPDVTEENIQARIRGNLLMSLSNKFGWLVLTTGNKSETAVGYCTLYGDMAGGFAVIKDVPKTLVYELAEFKNRQAGRPVIPKSIIEREPSAELRPDQKDQDSLPPYDKLDAILRAYIEQDMAYTEILKMGFDEDTVKRVIQMVDRNEYKRRQGPPGIKITPKAFGKDWRLPISNQYTKLYLSSSS